MKKSLLIGFQLFLIPLFCAANSSCGADWNCVYNEQVRLLEQKELKAQKELEQFRASQLELQAEELAELIRQNTLLEEQDQQIHELLNRLEESKKPEEDTTEEAQEN
jgi:hypothetical protein